MGDSEQRKPWPGAQSHRMMVPTTEETGMSAPSEMWHSLWQCVSALWTLGVCQRGHISLQRFLKTPSRAIDKPSKKVKLIQLLWFISVRMPRGMVAGSVFWGIYCLLSHSRSEESDSVKKSQSGFCFSKKKHAGKWTPNCNSMNSSLKWLSQTVSWFFFFLLAFPGCELDPLGSCKNSLRSQKYHSVV